VLDRVLDAPHVVDIAFLAAVLRSGSEQAIEDVPVQKN